MRRGHVERPNAILSSVVQDGHRVAWVELDPDGKAWLEDTEQRLYTVLSQSNFYTIMHQAFQDLTVFGTAPILIYEDAEDVARFYLPCAGEYYLANGGRLDQHARAGIYAQRATDRGYVSDQELPH